MGQSAYGMERAPGASVGHADNQSRMARNAEISIGHSTQNSAPESSNRGLGQAPFIFGERFDRQNTMPFIPGAFPSSVQPTVSDSSHLSRPQRRLQTETTSIHDRGGAIRNVTFTVPEVRETVSRGGASMGMTVPEASGAFPPQNPPVVGHPPPQLPQEGFLPGPPPQPPGGSLPGASGMGNQGPPPIPPIPNRNQGFAATSSAQHGLGNVAPPQPSSYGLGGASPQARSGNVPSSQFGSGGDAPLPRGPGFGTSGTAPPPQPPGSGTGSVPQAETLHRSSGAADAMDHRQVYRSYPWPAGWEFDPMNTTSMTVKMVKELNVVFDGDYTMFPSFREHVRSNIHMNSEFTCSLKSSLLAQALTKEPKQLTGARTTPKLTEFASMLTKLDTFYNRNKLVSFRETLKTIGVFDPLKPDAAILSRLIGLLNNAESQFGNEDVSPVIRDILRKLGGLTQSFLNSYPHENTWSLQKVNKFLVPFYNHYRGEVHKAPNLRNRVIAREAVPKREGLFAQKDIVLVPNTSLDSDLVHESEESPQPSSRPPPEPPSPESFQCGEEEYYVSQEKLGFLNRPVWKDTWPPCIACKGKHLLVFCPLFWSDQLSFAERKKLVVDNRRCFRCLHPAHTIAKCPRTEKCGFCLSGDHHTRLHDFSQGEGETYVTIQNSVFKCAKEPHDCKKNKKELNLCTMGFSFCFLKNPQTGQSIKVCLIRDSCASESVCCLSVARILGCTGTSRQRTTNGVGGCEWKTEVMTSMITLESEDGRCSQTFPLSFAEKPCGDLKFLDWRLYLDNHPQLEPIRNFLPRAGDDDSVLMILGTDHPDLISRPDETLPGPSWIGGEGYCRPFALRTVLGWSVTGYTGAQPPNAVEVINGKIVLSHLGVAYVGQNNSMECAH